MVSMKSLLRNNGQVSIETEGFFFRYRLNKAGERLASLPKDNRGPGKANPLKKYWDY